MVLIPVKCPYCDSDNIVKYGKNSKGIQVYYCRNIECSHKKFPEQYTYKACDPKVKKQIFSLTVNGNGTRSISRILEVSKDTVTAALKKSKMTYGK
jgi:transposase-like protein